MTMRIYGVVLLVLAVSWVASEPTCDTTDPECKPMIGEAYVERKPGRRFLLQTSTRPSAEFQNMAPHLANRRSLLAPMCSETVNTPEAVVACTNAVRYSPGSFAGDMRCSVSNRGGLGPLRLDSKLARAALVHAQDNARMGDLTHTGSDGSSVSTRVKRYGYNYRMVRENIAWGYDSAKDVVMGWMCSSGHRANIMSCDVHDIGVGVATGGGRPYHAQVFGCSSGDSCGCGGSGGADDTIPSSPTTPRDEPSSDKGSDSGSGSGSGDRPKYKDYYRKDDSGHGHSPDSGSDSGHSPKDHFDFGSEETPYSGPYRRRYRRYSPSGGHGSHGSHGGHDGHYSHRPYGRRGGEGRDQYKKEYKYGPGHDMFGDDGNTYSFSFASGGHHGR